MKQIYNKQTKIADLIEDNATPPEGWTDKHPRWTKYEAWDDTKGWHDSDELKIKKEKQKRIVEIDTELELLDKKSNRALRTKAIGKGSKKDDDKLLELDNQADTLRLERSKLL